MGSRKRLVSSMCSAEEGQENSNRELKIGGTLNLAQECERYLQANGLQVLVSSSHPGPLGAPFWWSLAELNITLAAFQHAFQDLQLLESTSFTKCHKALAFEKLAFARGCTDVWALQQQPQLQAVSLVLDSALLACPDAAIGQVTLLCPAFLAAWATRWMPSSSNSSGSGGSPPRLRLLIIQGYRPGAAPLRATTVYNLGLPNITSSPAHKTIYLPLTH